MRDGSAKKSGSVNKPETSPPTVNIMEVLINTIHAGKPLMAIRMAVTNNIHNPVAPINDPLREVMMP
jgi:hypothetical protein